MKELIRARALEMGFDACGFTTAEPPSNAGMFQQWLTEGRHGAMDYLQRNASKRVDPQKILPGARSVICLVASYGESSSAFGQHSLSVGGHLDQQTVDSGKPRVASPGLIARYGRNTDYHNVLGEQLKVLAQFVNQIGGSEARSLWYVDTGPLLERDLAQRAGVGFIGKHTNLISRRFGNWILLSEILTTVELPPDSSERNHCGRCTLCLEACPTRAITAPFELDARLCISYLTIELKGPIPTPLRPAIGRRIFGCDDCLEVCPWNRFAREGRLMRDHARADLQQPDLIGLLSLDEAGFKKRFAGTPMVRPKRRGLLRNVAVALGNTGNRSALPALERAAGDPEPLIAEHAQWAIQQIESRR